MPSFLLIRFVYGDTIHAEVVLLCLPFPLYFTQLSTNSFTSILYFNIDLKVYLKCNILCL
jgi:hypothetical protein